MLSGHTERVDSFAWQPGGEHLVSGGRDWRLTLWRPAKATQPIDVQMTRFGDQRGALVAGRQTRSRSARSRDASQSSSWSRDESRAARPARPTSASIVQQRFEELAAKRFAPSPKKPRQEVWWPQAPLDGRAFPEGIQPPEGDDSFNESARLIGFLNGVCGGEFYIANLSRTASRTSATREDSTKSCALDQDAPGVESHLPAGVDPRRVPHHRLADATTR